MQNIGGIFPGPGPVVRLPCQEVTEKCMRKPSEAQGKGAGFPYNNCPSCLLCFLLLLCSESLVIGF